MMADLFLALGAVLAFVLFVITALVAAFALAPAWSLALLILGAACCFFFLERTQR